VQSRRLSDPFEPLNSSQAQSAEELGHWQVLFLGRNWSTNISYSASQSVKNAAFATKLRTHSETWLDSAELNVLSEAWSWMLLILACRQRESFRQQLLRINGPEVSHHLSSVLCSTSNLTMWLTLWEPAYDMFVLRFRPKKQQFLVALTML